MVELVKQLKQEEEGLMTERGLPGFPTGVQTCELYVSAEWRRSFDAIYGTLYKHTVANRGGECGQLFTGLIRRRRGVPNTMPPASLLAAQRALNGFVQSFVDQSDPKHPRTIREMSCLSRVFGIPPDMQTDELG